MKTEGVFCKRGALDCGFDPAADWADAWRPLVSAVCHAAWARADLAGWTGSMARCRPAT